MKTIISIVALLALLFVADAQAFVRNIQDNAKITYAIIDNAGDHVSGQTPTVQIQRSSDGFWFDFNDSTFKNSGWTNKTTTLSEDSTNGFYYYTFNPPASETGAEQYVAVVDNADSTYGDKQTLSLEYQNIGSGTGTSTLTASDVWTAGTRTLTAGTNIVLAKGVGVTGFNDIAAADVWAAGTRTLTALDEDSTTLDLDGTTIGTVTTATNVTTVNGLAANVITAASIAASAITSSEAPNLDAAISTRASQTSLDTVDDYVDTEVAAIKAKTDSLTFTTANKVDARTFTNDDKTGYSLAADQAVNVTKWSGTTVATPDTAGYPKVTLKSGTGTGEVSLSSGTVTVGTNNDKTGYRLSATGVDDIWDEAQSGHTTAGTFGKYLDNEVSEASAPTADAVADAVWDEAISGHLTAGTTGNKLNSAESAGDPWLTELPGSYTGAQAGFYLQDLIKRSRGR